MKISCPVRNNDIIVEEITRALREGRIFLDPHGNQLTDLDGIAEALRRYGRVLAPQPRRHQRV